MPDALPPDETVIRAVELIVKGNQGSPWMPTRLRGATASEVARNCRIKGARRHGRGAVRGSWSGTMSPALRIAPRLRSLVKRVLLVGHYDAESYRWEFYPPDKTEGPFDA